MSKSFESNNDSDDSLSKTRKLGGRAIAFCFKTVGLAEEVGETDAQRLFCVLSVRFLETAEAALLLASAGFQRQSNGVMRSALEGLASCAILARRPEFSKAIAAFELADRFQEFEKLKQLRAGSEAKDLAPESLAVDLDKWQEKFNEDQRRLHPEFVDFHKRLSFESSRQWKPYQEEEFERFSSYTPPTQIRKPEIWKLLEFGRWLPEALRKLDVILHMASVNSHFNFSTLQANIRGESLVRERGSANPVVALANVLEVVFLWLALVDESFPISLGGQLLSS